MKHTKARGKEGREREERRVEEEEKEKEREPQRDEGKGRVCIVRRGEHCENVSSLQYPSSSETLNDDMYGPHDRCSPY